MAPLRGKSPAKPARYFAHFSDRHHGAPHIAVLVKTGSEDELANLCDNQAEAYFRPAYYGASGWVGLILNRPDVDWDHVADWLQRSWKAIAPKRLIQQSVQQPTGPKVHSHQAADRILTARTPPPRPHPLARASLVDRLDRWIGSAWDRGWIASVPLTPEALVERASRGYSPQDERVGRSQADVADFHQRLAALCNAIEEQAQLNSLGRAFAYGLLMRAIRQRFALGELWRQRPDILETHIAAADHRGRADAVGHDPHSPPDRRRSCPLRHAVLR